MIVFWVCVCVWVNQWELILSYRMASTKRRGSNACKSSIFSPTPTYLTGTFIERDTLITHPPFDVPSSCIQVRSGVCVCEIAFDTMNEIQGVRKVGVSVVAGSFSQTSQYSMHTCARDAHNMYPHVLLCVDE